MYYKVYTRLCDNGSYLNYSSVTLCFLITWKFNVIKFIHIMAICDWFGKTCHLCTKINIEEYLIQLFKV